MEVAGRRLGNIGKTPGIAALDSLLVESKAVP